MEDVKNANGYPVNKAVEELMNVVTRGGEPVLIKIHSILPITGLNTKCGMNDV